MDQRRPAPHPFSRPQTSQPFHETRFAPIPPPPYTSQSTTHSNATHHNGDPFLRRRNEQQNPRTSPVPAEPPRPYAFVNNPQLTANLFPGASDFANIAQQRRNSYGSATPFGAGGIDRYGPRTASGERVLGNIHLLQYAGRSILMHIRSSFPATALRRRLLLCNPRFSGHLLHCALVDHLDRFSTVHTIICCKHQCRCSPSIHEHARSIMNMSCLLLIIAPWLWIASSPRLAWRASVPCDGDFAASQPFWSG